MSEHSLHHNLILVGEILNSKWKCSILQVTASHSIQCLICAEIYYGAKQT